MELLCGKLEEEENKNVPNGAQKLTKRSTKGDSPSCLKIVFNQEGLSPLVDYFQTNSKICAIPR